MGDRLSMVASSIDCGLLYIVAITCIVHRPVLQWNWNLSHRRPHRPYPPDLSRRRTLHPNPIRIQPLKKTKTRKTRWNILNRNLSQNRNPSLKLCQKRTSHPNQNPLHPHHHLHRPHQPLLSLQPDGFATIPPPTTTRCSPRAIAVARCHTYTKAV